MEAKGSRPSPAWPIARAALIVLAAGVPGGLALRWLIAPGDAAAVEARLAAAGFSRARLREIHPERARPNDAALRLEAAAAGLGIDLVPEHRPHRALAEPDLKGAKDWLRARLASPSARVAAPPPSVREWLVAEEEDIRAVREALSAELPAWEDDAGRSHFLGVGRLAEVLLVHALAETTRGNPDSARASLEAAMRIARSRRMRPWVTDQLLAARIEGDALVVARKLRLPPGWSEATNPRLVRRRMAECLAQGAYADLDAARGATVAELRETQGAWLPRWLTSRPATPILRRSLVAGASESADEAALLARPDVMKHLAPRGSVPRGDAWAAIIDAPEPGAFTASIARLEMHRELTEHVLAHRSGARPAVLPASELRDVAWTAGRQGRHVTIALAPVRGAWWEQPTHRALWWTSAP